MVNAFWLDRDVDQATRWLVDSHVTSSVFEWHTVSLNDVQFAPGRERNVHLSGRDDVVQTSTWVNNDEIPEWWVTHANNNETTTVTVDPSIVVKYAGVSVPAKKSTRTRTFNTSLLEPLETQDPRRFSAFDRTVYVVDAFSEAEDADANTVGLDVDANRESAAVRVLYQRVSPWKSASALTTHNLSIVNVFSGPIESAQSVIEPRPLDFNPESKASRRPTGV